MVVGGEMYKAGQLSQQAIERLVQDGLLPTPRNYSVYYEYFSGRNPELNCAYDAVVANGKMSQQQCDEIYYKYLISNKEISFFSDADSLLDNELKKILEALITSAKGTDQYGESLGAFSGKLTRSFSVDTLREAVERISEETQVISEQNSKLQQELADTTVQLCEIRNDFDRVHREAQRDPLTEVGNRKFFDQEIVRAIEETGDQQSMMALLMVDIDHFKRFNDTHGHLIGDQVLRLVAHTLVENLKGRDVICRYGGEEFVIILPQTRLQDAERVANHLRVALSTKRITKRGTNETLGVVTISIGAAEYVPGEDSDMLISRADGAMYKAKQTGRNKVVCAGEETAQA